MLKSLFVIKNLKLTRLKIFNKNKRKFKKEFPAKY